jgi:hypothetical protein
VSLSKVEGAKAPGETDRAANVVSSLSRTTRIVYDFDVPPVPVSVTTMLTDFSAPGESRLIVRLDVCWLSICIVSPATRGLAVRVVLEIVLETVAV